MKSVDILRWPGKGIVAVWLSNRFSQHPLIYSSILCALTTLTYAVFTDGVMRDDAYIFFQYARNLAETGMLSFNVGEQSYGVTSILWTALLAAGSFIITDTVILAKFYGILFAALGTVLWAKWIINDSYQKHIIFAVGIAALLPLIGSGRMINGMETSLQCFVSGLYLTIISSRLSHKYWWAGFVGGILFLVRPEMIIFPCGTIVYLLYRKRIFDSPKTILAMYFTSAWWPIWLYMKTGGLFPPTKNGKLSVFLPAHLNISLAEFNDGNIIERIIWGISSFVNFVTASPSHSIFLFLLCASVVVVVLATIKIGFTAAKRFLVAPVTVLILLFLYCLIFPLLKLRYFVWLSPALLVTLFAAFKIIMPATYFIMTKRSATVILLLLFLPGVKQQIRSTNIQQVRRLIAEEIKLRTPINSRIALEPIGEIGYYSNRYIVDLGGLVDISIQKYIRNGYNDLGTILQCLEDKRADYLVTPGYDRFLSRLPSLYPNIFESTCTFPKDHIAEIRYRLFKINRNRNDNNTHLIGTL